MFPTTAKCIHFVRKCFLCSCIRQMCRTSCRMSEPFTCSVSRTKFFPSFRRRQHRLPKIKTSSFSISFLSHSELESNSKVFFEVFEEDEAHILLPFHEMLRNAQKNISTIIKCEKLILIISSRVWNARNSRIQMRHQWTNVIQAQLGCLMSHCSELIS